MSQTDRLQNYYAYYETRAFLNGAQPKPLDNSTPRDVADPTRRPAPQGQRAWEDGS